MTRLRCLSGIRLGEWVLAESLVPLPFLEHLSAHPSGALWIPAPFAFDQGFGRGGKAPSAVPGQPARPGSSGVFALRPRLRSERWPSGTDRNAVSRWTERSGCRDRNASRPTKGPSTPRSAKFSDLRVTRRQAFEGEVNANRASRTDPALLRTRTATRTAWSAPATCPETHQTSPVIEG